MPHSLIAPSSAHIWSKCTGSVLLAQQYPETEESETAREGTASHEVAQRMIHAGLRANIGMPKRSETVGTVATNGIVIDDDMFDGAELYAHEVCRVASERHISGGEYIGVEATVRAPSVHAESYGSVDAFIFDRPHYGLFVWDYKYGFVPVEVFENEQLINYVAAILDQFGVCGVEDQMLTIHFNVIQPRAHHRDGPVRRWSIKAADIRAHINRLSAAAHVALGPDATLQSGTQCRYCQARHACPAARNAGVALYESCLQPVGEDLTPEALAAEYSIVTRATEQIKALSSGYEEQIRTLIRSGTNVPGYVLQEGKGRETWKVPFAQVAGMGDMLNTDLRKLQLITPNQARAKGLDPDVIGAFTERPNTGLKLVPVDTNRARGIFT